MRAEIRLRKSKFSKEDLMAMSVAAVNRLESMEQWQQAERVLLYASMADEVNTRDLIYRYQGKKKIYLPVVMGKEIEIREYRGEAEMAIGAYGISEPTTERYDGEIDLAIVPAIAMDLHGNRLGHGGGYYDKLLSRLKCSTIGLIFPFQLLDSVPTEPHDVRLGGVVY